MEVHGWLEIHELIVWKKRTRYQHLHFAFALHQHLHFGTGGIPGSGIESCGISTFGCCMSWHTNTVILEVVLAKGDFFSIFGMFLWTICLNSQFKSFGESF